MTKLISLVLAFAVGQAVASSIPTGENLARRQSSTKNSKSSRASKQAKTPAAAAPGQSNPKGTLSQVLAAQSKGKLGEFMGEPEATEAFTALAKMMGANKNSAGTLGSFSRNMSKGYGIVPAPAGSVAAREVRPSRSGVTGAKTIKVRYGPYKVPSMGTKNQLGLNGMLSNFPHTDMAKPCEGACTVLGIEAGLEYVNGTNANINTGLWLHHMVLFNVGPGREDPPCAHRDISLPHATIGGTPRNSERIFASGNERTRASFADWGVKDAGYKLQPADKFAALVELMNENMFDVTVFMTVTYDYIEGHPFKDEVKCIWFDVRQCGTSEVNPPKNQRKFILDYQWKASVDAEVIGSIEHLHDGGSRMTLTNDGKMACDSTSAYGTKPEFVGRPAAAGPAGGHSHGGGGMKHISEQPVCHTSTLAHKTMKKGQLWEMKSYYDFDAWQGNTHPDGALDEVMGIAIMYVRKKA